jgi:hypothetical protein
MGLFFGAEEEETKFKVKSSSLSFVATLFRIENSMFFQRSNDFCADLRFHFRFVCGRRSSNPIRSKSGSEGQNSGWGSNALCSHGICCKPSQVNLRV